MCIFVSIRKRRIEIINDEAAAIAKEPICLCDNSKVVDRVTQIQAEPEYDQLKLGVAEAIGRRFQPPTAKLDTGAYRPRLPPAKDQCQNIRGRPPALIVEPPSIGASDLETVAGQYSIFSTSCRMGSLRRRSLRSLAARLRRCQASPSPLRKASRWREASVSSANRTSAYLEKRDQRLTTQVSFRRRIVSQDDARIGKTYRMSRAGDRCPSRYGRRTSCACRQRVFHARKALAE